MSEPDTEKFGPLHGDSCPEPTWSPTLGDNVKVGRGAMPTASLLSPWLVSRAYGGGGDRRTGGGGSQKSQYAWPRW